MSTKFTPAALKNISETSADVESDIAALRTRERLLAYGFDGAEPDRVEGWRDYVSEVARLAEVSV